MCMLPRSRSVSCVDLYDLDGVEVRFAQTERGRMSQLRDGHVELEGLVVLGQQASAIGVDRHHVAAEDELIDATDDLGASA